MRALKKLNKRMRYMIVGLAIVFGGLILFNIVKKIIMGYFFSHYQPPAVTVSSVLVKEQDWKPHLHAVGNFLAINGVEVNSQASGNVVDIHFQSGEYVTKDAPLLEIDDSIDQATLKFHQAELVLQELNYKRQSELLKTGSTSSASVDETRAKQLEAKANVEKTEALIRQKHIKAPFTGQLGIRTVNLGQYIIPGQTAIVTLQSLDPLFIEFYLPEQYLDRVQMNQSILVSLEQYPHVRFQGKITAVNPKADAKTHNIKIQATLANCPIEIFKHPEEYKNLYTIKPIENSDQKQVQCNTEKNAENNISKFSFIPGMFVSIDVEQPVIPHQIILPSTSISYSLYGDSVFVIEGNGELTVKQVFVKIGGQQGNQTLIKQGLKPGQRVVSSGELKLQNGTRVVINNDIPLDHEPPNDLSE